ENSNVVNALINAAKNGKKVTAVIELQARFDEEANIYWSKKLKEEGVNVFFGIPGLKTHCKLCLITRREEGKNMYYANIGTGNFNEKTSRIYSDHGLFTSNSKITTEVNKVFNYFRDQKGKYEFNQLVVSPFQSREKFNEWIDIEIDNAKQGKRAYILLKMNSLVDKSMIMKLYEASCAGVNVKLIVRGVCSLIPGIKGLSDNIEAISIVDKFLEHSRVFIFCNNGDEKYYISSADWMTRNLDHRVEVTCPIFDKNIQKELKKMLEMQW
ncbi:MAG: phospholipase D-like domain-containing protein, partial [Flavobacteriales bacterium]